MNKSAEISKDGRTLTVNTFKDLKHFLDRVLYKHFQITVDKPIKELIIKDSKTDWTVNYVKELLRNAALQTVENFEIISPDSRFCTIDGLLYSGSGENLYLCPIGREGTLIIPDGTKMIFVEACRNCKFDKIVLPDSVEIIDKYSFSRSWNLKEVEGGKNVERIRDYASLIKACMRSDNLQHCHECNTWRLKIEGKPDVIVPKSCSTKSYATLMANKINTMINKPSNGEVVPPELYRYSTNSTGLTAALEQCRRYPNGNLRRFITRNIGVIFTNLIITPLDDSGEEIMVSLIKDGVFTDVALKKILEEIEKTGERRNLTTLKAYVLNTIDKSTNTFQI